MRSLGKRGLVVSGFADWETYADQIRGLRTKVWLPTQKPPRTLRRVLRPPQVRDVMLEVLTPPLPPREWLTDQERPWHAVFRADVWLPYSIFTTHVYQRLGQLVGERPMHRGRLKWMFYRHLLRLEEDGIVRIARQNGQRIFLRQQDKGSGLPTNVGSPDPIHGRKAHDATHRDHGDDRDQNQHRADTEGCRGTAP